ncbi:MAG: PAS domain S-box protein [Deltaproteobacteria bacterium]|nr:PAS domain S-box protein [Deltaproteobacteria bacterium]
MESNEVIQAKLKETAEALSEQKEVLHQTSGFLESVLENSKDIIFRTNSDGALVFFGKGGESALGYVWEELSGSDIKDLAEKPPDLESLVNTCIKDKEVIRKEITFRHKNGSAVHCRMVLLPLTNTREEVIGMTGVCRDITAWRKFKADLIRVDRLAEVGRIASGIVHELNNPVAVIGEIAGWIGAVVSDAEGLDEEDREELKTSVRHIGEQTKRCRNITGQLLSFVRESKLTTTSLDAHELLKETVDLLTPELKFTDVEIVYNFVQGTVFIDSDKQLLEQVFVNFISNAVYAVKEKGDKRGRITLETYLDDTGKSPMVEIKISDTGVGISRADQKKIYEYFFTTKPPGKGTGLGLPISRDIIKNLGGSLSFESEPGEGTTFNIRLPVS